MAKSVLLRHISNLTGILPEGTTRLIGTQMSQLSSVSDAYLLIENGLIKRFGPDAECAVERADQTIDCTGKMVIPAYCDSHTHIVFAGWREGEFVDRLKGMSYVEIDQRGGGILNSAKKLQQTSEDELFDQALIRLHEVIKLGTGAIEIKSGYGLTVESELKMLRVIRRLKDVSPIPVKSNFLGAHAFPMEYKQNRSQYIALITNEMIPRIAGDGLADYVDVFCDTGFFSVDETEAILKAGAKYGLKPKIHANELDYSGGIQVGVKHGAISVDHLQCTGPNEIKSLAGSSTVATILPSTAFFLGLPYAPAREMIDNKICVALASDYNPGSSPSGNMSFIFSLACVKLKMLPEEALNALTINGAAAMELGESHGSITLSKPANLIISKANMRLEAMPYFYADNWIDTVLINGIVQ
jgi:imidazolonepropionase